MFSCRHRRTTFPQTPKSKFPAVTNKPRVSCLDCGRGFVYDWQEMRVVIPSWWDRIQEFFSTNKSEKRTAE
jgi:hypothetical protein